MRQIFNCVENSMKLEGNQYSAYLSPKFKQLLSGPYYTYSSNFMKIGP